jgi:hypothetical protein
LQGFVHEAVATTDALEQEALGAVVEQEVVAEGGVAVGGEDDAEKTMLKKSLSTSFKSSKPNNADYVAKND